MENRPGENRSFSLQRPGTGAKKKGMGQAIGYAFLGLTMQHRTLKRRGKDTKCKWFSKKKSEEGAFQHGQLRKRSSIKIIKAIILMQIYYFQKEVKRWFICTRLWEGSGGEVFLKRCFSRKL